MIAFSVKGVKAILAGKKNVTFRKWPKARVRVGGVYDAATIGYPPKAFAKLRVTGLRLMRLGAIDDNLARRDGADSASAVRAYWTKQGFDLSKELWLVEFELVK